MNKHLLSRRQFAARCAAFGLTVPAWSAALAAQVAPAAGTAAPPKPAARTVRLPDGTTVSPLGQGCWHLGQGRHPPAVEEEALRTGIALGMTLIDTSGNYGNGRSEQFLGHALEGQRERVFLVSKVEGNQVSGDGIARACAASLARLGAAQLDLYLLHWPIPSTQFPGVVAAFEQLRAAGKIRAWGVSNFNVGQMEDLFRVAGRPPLRHQPGCLQPQQPQHRARPPALVQTAQPAGHGVLAARRRQQSRREQPHAGAGRRRPWLHGCRGRAGMGDSQRRRDRDSRIRLSGARQGKCCGACDCPHAAGPCDAGCGVPRALRRDLASSGAENRSVLSLAAAARSTRASRTETESARPAGAS